MDASDQCFEAVRYAGLMLPTEQTKFTLFHVRNVIPESLWDLESGPDLRFRVTGFHAWEIQQQKMIEAFMDQANRLLTSMGHPAANILHVVRDKRRGIARDIAAEARENYHALVMGRRGISELKDLILGSTADKVLNHVQDVSVWVVGESPAPGRVLVALDGSEAALRALDYVGDMLRGTNVEVLLLYVSRGLGFLESGLDELLLIDEEKRWLSDARQALRATETSMDLRFQECIRRLAQKGLDPDRMEARIVRGSHSRSGTIVEEARLGGFGTIVVGRRGLSRVEEFIMGRVSNKVMQLARDIAVWVVH